VEENVLHVAHDLRAPSQPILARPVRAGKVKVVGAVYDLETASFPLSTKADTSDPRR
jgi:hypothetical protein